jgi:hypothetical protein
MRTTTRFTAPIARPQDSENAAVTSVKLGDVQRPYSATSASSQVFGNANRDQASANSNAGRSPRGLWGARGAHLDPPNPGSTIKPEHTQCR